MRVEAWVMVMLVAVAIAGCLESPVQDAEVLSAADGAPGVVPGPRSDPAGSAASDVESFANVPPPAWHRLDTTADADAPLTAFWWTIPNGSILSHPVVEEWRVLSFEVALLLPEDAQLTEWAFFAFVEDDEGLVLVSSRIATPQEAASFGAVNAFEIGGAPITADPFFLRVVSTELEVGDRLGFVLAARARAPTPIALALRPLDHVPASDEKPAPSQEEFLRVMGPDAPGALRASGVGAGMQVAIYIEFSGLLFVPFSYGVSTPHVKVDGGMVADARPAGGIRDMRLSASYDRPGWTSSSALYWVNAGGGEWSCETDAHGVSWAGGGALAAARAVPESTPLSDLLRGMPFCYASGDGEGGSASHMHVTSASMNAAGAELFAFSQLDLGATLTDLLGAEGVSRAFGVSSPIGSHTVARAGEDLILTSEDGVQHVLVGALPPAGIDGARNG